MLTLLHQDRTGGLQAKNAAGRWIDVPPRPGTYVVNLGTVLQRWSRGRFRATPHRVLGRGEERTSVPFFFEPAVDAVIEPIPAEMGAREADEDLVPVRYGDLLVHLMQRFVETRGVAVS